TLASNLGTVVLYALICALTFVAFAGGKEFKLFKHGVTFGSSLPASTFFLTTGIHGAHVTAGVIALLYLVHRSAKGAYGKDNWEPIEYFGYYWHFVDIVWVFLFPLFYLV
ncbi:MAG: cytochrome c oxidase subunit 3, partial [Nitrososphaeria archaeon]|nr:cytochrome c oxidase subunit 3 [Nitrososphaeria archaeon]